MNGVECSTAFVLGFIETVIFINLFSKKHLCLFNSKNINQFYQEENKAQTMDQRMCSKGKENLTGLECENTGVQGYMSAFLFFPLKSKKLKSLVNTF